MGGPGRAAEIQDRVALDDKWFETCQQPFASDGVYEVDSVETFSCTIESPSNVPGTEGGLLAHRLNLPRFIRQNDATRPVSPLVQTVQNC